MLVLDMLTTKNASRLKRPSASCESNPHQHPVPSTRLLKRVILCWVLLIPAHLTSTLSPPLLMSTKTNAESHFSAQLHFLQTDQPLLIASLLLLPASHPLLHPVYLKPRKIAQITQITQITQIKQSKQSHLHLNAHRPLTHPLHPQTPYWRRFKSTTPASNDYRPPLPRPLRAQRQDG